MAESPSVVPPYGIPVFSYRDFPPRQWVFFRWRSRQHPSMLRVMPNYRRLWVPGGTWFFTVNLLERQGNDLLIREINRLRDCVSRERERRPFSIIAWVVLPEHMHWIWRLPDGDADFATRWRRIKTDFSLGILKTERRSLVRVRRGERGIWQRRYWEHAIRDDIDLQRHIDYVHYNPVKHGHVTTVADWPHSSFHRYVQMQHYPADWVGI